MIGLIWSSGIEGVLHGMNKVGYWFIRISNWNGLEKMGGGGGVQFLRTRTLKNSYLSATLSVNWVTSSLRVFQLIPGTYDYF